MPYIIETDRWKVTSKGMASDSSSGEKKSPLLSYREMMITALKRFKPASRLMPLFESYFPSVNSFFEMPTLMSAFTNATIESITKHSNR